MLNPRYEDICRAYGISYGLVLSRDELHERVAEMLNATGPYLLECAVDEEDNVLPMTKPGCRVDEMRLSI
jgi:acetolactate synthase-1/2/3 large subunit